MRLSEPGNEPKIAETTESTGARDPSYPDRARIDSDVRALLREPSTPWIVFDKDSRVDQAELRRTILAAGHVLLSSRSSSLLSEPSPALAAPPPAAPPAADAPALEPSGMTVASDLVPDAAPTVRPTSFSIDVEELSVGAAGEDAGEAGAALPFTRGGRFVGLGIAAAATLLAVVGVLAVRPASSASPVNAPAAAAAPARAAEEIPPPEAAPARADDKQVDVPSAEAPKAAAAASPSSSAPSADGKKHSKFGRLTIKGDARYKHVFFDGKRMLGRGTRGFAVLCGTHTIAVDDRSDVREVDVPCDGEFVVTK